MSEEEGVSHKSSCDRPSNRIPVSELRDYVKEKANCRDIFKEFDSLRCGQYTYKEVSRKRENWAKNRYDTLVAYDHNRVVLDIIDSDPDSDYINANYIDGYSRPRKFIAAQGPLPSTVLDFWRMVWQENTRRIAMVTGTVEGTYVKCERYWPEKSQSYGPVKVDLKDFKHFPKYDIRTFQITNGEEERVLVHFHFTDWKDQQVPEDHEALAQFVRVFRAAETKEEGATIVHCSAGIARTGVVIMLDIMLEMAAAENAVDLLAYLWTMRKQRYNAISAPEQYFFTYSILAEHLLEKNTPDTP